MKSLGEAATDTARAARDESGVASELHGCTRYAMSSTPRESGSRLWWCPYVRRLRQSDLCDRVHNIFAIVQEDCGSALRSPFAAEAAQLRVGGLRRGRRMVGPILQSARAHQVLRRGFRGMLAVRGGRIGSRAP